MSINKAMGFGIAVALGAAIGIYITSDQERHEQFVRSLKYAASSSTQKVSQITEELALKKAMITNNPQVNQEWVEKQWDNLV